MKLDLLTNATIVDDAIKFVTGYSKNRAIIVKQGQDKDKADVVVHDLEASDIQRSEEASEYQPGESTTNSVF